MRGRVVSQCPCTEVRGYSADPSIHDGQTAHAHRGIGRRLLTASRCIWNQRNAPCGRQDTLVASTLRCTACSRPARAPAISHAHALYARLAQSSPVSSARARPKDSAKDLGRRARLRAPRRTRSLAHRVHGAGDVVDVGGVEAGHRDAPVFGEVDVVVVDHRVDLGGLQAGVAEHADLVGDVCPVTA